MYTLFPGVHFPVLCCHLRAIWLIAHVIIFSIRSHILRASASTADTPQMPMPILVCKPLTVYFNSAFDSQNKSMTVDIDRVQAMAA